MARARAASRLAVAHALLQLAEDLPPLLASLTHEQIWARPGASASIGFQLGAQARSVVIMFMTPEALASFRRVHGWKIGVDGSVALELAVAAGITQGKAAALIDAASALILEEKLPLTARALPPWRNSPLTVSCGSLT